MLRVKMIPNIGNFRTEESGIKRVVEAYFNYLPKYGIDLVAEDATSYDLLAAHAGMGEGTADIAHLHGLYWTADYSAPMWEYKSNARIITEIRQAKSVTVPSSWVAEPLQRDLRLNPYVVGHGIEWDKWQHNYDSEGYVLWNKNRIGDVCSPDDLNKLARVFKHIEFISTFGNGANMEKYTPAEIWNLRELKKSPQFMNIGLRKHKDMKKLIQMSGVYLSTTKETFGIGILEAMAAGIPVLGYKWGGNVDLIQHGVNGYLAVDFDDLCDGLNYCLEHRKTLGENSRELAKQYTWEKVAEQIAGIYRETYKEDPASVSVVIPVYNKPPEEIKRAINSCLEQSLKPKEIIIVEDGCPNNTGWEAYQSYMQNPLVKFVDQENSGVAVARNTGIELTNTKYICCLDSDDWVKPEFLETCVNALEEDRSLGIAYTRLQWHKPDGTTGISDWPSAWNYDDQLKRKNQIPTCCVYKKEMWERLGGYKKRYCPQGAGSEDAEFWTRAGAYGFKAALVTNEALFDYSWLSGTTAQAGYSEVDWLALHPWSKDEKHPFGSYASSKGLSHKVRQYDEPNVSIVIPVGENHMHLLEDALDSIESNTYRKWETIVVFDFAIEEERLEKLLKAYPYLKHTITENKGAGYARNRGAELARSPLLLFLDADDTLYPETLERLIETWNNEQKAVYSNYVGHSYINNELAVKLEKENRLYSYDSKTGESIIGYRAYPFDCARAIRQPDNPPYLWCNITTLIPTKWHFDIGGFDEQMPTWEDWDYWLRMVKAGRCFYHLEEELLRYRFYTGSRRDLAVSDRQMSQNMLSYLQEKYKGIKPMGCNCGNKKDVKTAKTEGTIAAMDNMYIRAKYLGHKGNHHIIGAYKTDTNPGVPAKRNGNKWVHYYGYAQGGHISLVHKEDIRLMVGKWEVLPEVEVEKVETPKPKPQAIKPEPIKVEEKLDLQTIPGVTDSIAKKLLEAGLDTEEKILTAGITGLTEIKGIAEKRASLILSFLEG